jgi:hypothetical protein
MANLYTVSSPATLIFTNRCLFGFYNNLGSGKKIKLMSLQILNNQTVAITGIANVLTMNRLSSAGGGTLLSPLKHDSATESVPGQIIFGTNLDYTSQDVLRRVPWSTDEPIFGTINSVDEVETNTQLCYLIDNTYELINTASPIQPYTFRPGEGFGLINITTTAVGQIDIFCVVEIEDE